MDRPKVISNLLFTIAFGLICLLGTMALITAISFFVHIPVSGWHFPLAVIITLVLSFYYTGTLNLSNRWRHLLVSVGGVLLVIIVSILVAGQFYDLSFDGQYYHQEAIYHIGHQQWNPFYSTISLPDNVMGAVWVNHYPKQAETSSALIYALTKRIETGKAINIILILASLFLTCSFLTRHTTLRTGKVWLLSILLAFNPVALHQMFTYLVDGQLASLLLCLLMICLFIYRHGGKDKLVLFFFIVLVTLNVKLTAIVFTGIFIIYLLLMLFLKKQLKLFWQVFMVAAAGAIISVLIIGFNPFVTNTITKQNPFYPLLGKNAVDIMTFTSPAGFPQKNRFEKMFITIFSHTDNIDKQVTDRVPQLKVPFTFNKLDIKSLAYPDNRIGGFGPLFSGIFLLAVFFIIWLLVFRRQMLIKNYLAGFILMLVLSVLVLEEAWWARYVPQFWFIPVIVLLMVEGADNKWISRLKNFTYGVMMLNLAMCFAVIFETNLLKTAEINYQLKQFKATEQPIRITYNRFDSNRVRFDEHNVPYIKSKVAGDDSSAISVVFSRARVKVAGAPPALPKPWLIKIADHLKDKK